jgi:hypothetical protein
MTVGGAVPAGIVTVLFDPLKVTDRIPPPGCTVMVSSFPVIMALRTIDLAGTVADSDPPDNERSTRDPTGVDAWTPVPRSAMAVTTAAADGWVVVGCSALMSVSALNTIPPPINPVIRQTPMAMIQGSRFVAGERTAVGAVAAPLTAAIKIVSAIG